MNNLSVDLFDLHQPCRSSTQKWIIECVSSNCESMGKVLKAGITAGVSTFHPFSKEPIKYTKQIFRMVHDLSTSAFNIFSAAIFKVKSVTKSNVWSVSCYYVAGERVSSTSWKKCGYPSRPFLNFFKVVGNRVLYIFLNSIGHKFVKRNAWH